MPHDASVTPGTTWSGVQGDNRDVHGARGASAGSDTKWSAGAGAATAALTVATGAAFAASYISDDTDHNTVTVTVTVTVTGKGKGKGTPARADTDNTTGAADDIIINTCARAHARAASFTVTYKSSKSWTPRIACGKTRDARTSACVGDGDSKILR